MVFKNFLNPNYDQSANEYQATILVTWISKSSIPLKYIFSSNQQIELNEK